MEKINTALVSAFARAYHTQHAVQPVFEDHAARELFLPEEYENMAAAFAAGRFFCGFFLEGRGFFVNFVYD